MEFASASSLKEEIPDRLICVGEMRVRFDPNQAAESIAGGRSGHS